MKEYTFYTINTVVDIGDGKNECVLNGNITTTLNLYKLIECVTNYDYPMMVSISIDENVDLTIEENKNYYNLPSIWGVCDIYTLKFTLSKNINLTFDGIPLVIPSIVNNNRISKFIENTELSNIKNISINKESF